MTEIKKDTNLLNGKGENDSVEWITVNGSHIPIKDGEIPKQAIKNHFENKTKVNNDVQNYSPEFKQEVQKLANVLKQVKNLRQRELVDYIKSLDPIKLQIKDDEILAEFDVLGAKKNIYEHGRSDKDGFDYKISNVDKLPSMIKNSKYFKSSDEIGKDKPAHKGVKKWHYFTKDIVTNNGSFNVLVNVRDKGENKYIYEVALKRKKT